MKKFRLNLRKPDHDPSGSCVSSVYLIAPEMQLSISFLLCPGCHLLNCASPWIAELVHSTYLVQYITSHAQLHSKYLGRSLLGKRIKSYSRSIRTSSKNSVGLNFWNRLQIVFSWNKVKIIECQKFLITSKEIVQKTCVNTKYFESNWT